MMHNILSHVLLTLQLEILGSSKYIALLRHQIDRTLYAPISQIDQP